MVDRGVEECPGKQLVIISYASYAMLEKGKAVGLPLLSLSLP